MTGLDQLLQRLPVKWLAKALVHDLPIPLEPIGIEGAENIVGVGLAATRFIDVFHADPPLADLRTGVQIATHRSHKRTQMQRPGGGWGEPPNVFRFLQVFSGLREEDARVNFQPSQSGAR
jgi:hypothetical protein